MNTPSLPTPSRRQVVGAAAWTLPVVAVAGAAPAFASSPNDCQVGASLKSTGTWSVAGALRSDEMTEWSRQTGWFGAFTGTDTAVSGVDATSSYAVPQGTLAGFASGADGSVAGTTTVITVVYSFESVAGAAYSIMLPTTMGYAYNWGAQGGQRQFLEARVGAAATVTSQEPFARVATAMEHAWVEANLVTSGHMQSASDLTAAGWEVRDTSSNGTPLGGAAGHSWTSPATGTAQIRLTFTLPPVPVTFAESTSAPWVHGDLWVAAPTITTTSCPV